MSVDISHRNLAWLSTADDVCSRRKRGESPREMGGRKGGVGSFMEIGGDLRLGCLLWMSSTDITYFECRFHFLASEESKNFFF